jgi:lactoylglutathione lyase
MSHFGFTKLVVADLDRSADFYTSVFGLTEQARIDSAIEGRPIREIMFQATAPGGAQFVLLKFMGEPAPSAGESILGFMTPDLDALVARAEAAGGRLADPIRELKQHGVRVCFLRDPEGRLVEVVQSL